MIFPIGSVTGLKFSSLDFITYASTLTFRRGGEGREERGGVAATVEGVGVHFVS